MIGFIISCIYNCCFRVKQTKFEAVFDHIEELTEEEFSRLMRYYNTNTCC